jgi:hypothetical protein
MSASPQEEYDDEPRADKFYTWVVEFQVNEIWVADGFNLTDKRAKKWIERDLLFSFPEETKTKVIQSPPKELLRKF